MSTRTIELRTVISALRIAARRVLVAGLFLLPGGCRDAREQALHDLKKQQIEPVPAALTDAVGRRDGAAIGTLAAAGVRAPVPAKGDASVLQTAALAGAWDLIPKLLPLCGGETVNHAGTDGVTVLEMAVKAGQPAMAESLLAAGALPENAADIPELLSQCRPQPALLDRLIMLLPPGHPALGTALLEAVTAGETARVDQLLAHGANPAAKDNTGSTPLVLACKGGFGEVVASLVKNGAKPSDSPAALSFAVKRGDVAICRQLMTAGANASRSAVESEPDATPLLAALKSGNLPLIDELLTPEAPSGLCYDFALNQGPAGLLELLFKHKVSADTPLPDGNPPLVKATIEGKAELVASLLKNGVLLETPGALGQTAYHMAVINQNSAIATLLLDAGVKPDAPFSKPAPEELLPLFDNEYFVKWFNRDAGLTPLMLAAARGDTGMIRLLLAKGARRGAQTKDWHRYPIVFACDNARIPAAQLLLGRDPDKETERRYAVISLSKQRVSLYKNDVLVRRASVSTGKGGHSTPEGKYVITDKQVDWVSSIYKVPMPYFMRLSCKDIGLHQGNVPGYPASHGCIRMPKSDVQLFYKTLKIGDPVTIEP